MSAPEEREQNWYPVSQVGWFTVHMVRLATVRRRLDLLGGLLFREPQQLLDPGAEAGIGGALLLPDLAAGFGQLPRQGRGLLAVLAGFGLDLPDVLIDRVAVVAPHHRRELTQRGLFGEAGQLGVNVRLHVA